jgi:decaprenylphospho-beta-D-ribofuranose 2-oxidase
MLPADAADTDLAGADAGPGTATLGAVTAPIVPARLAGWGGGPRVEARVLRPRRLDMLPGALERCRAHGHLERGAIARGMGRSYGDAAQLDGGLVIDTGGLKGLVLDPAAGTVTAEAGVTIFELLERLVPLGWIVPVLPGTQHVSVGGAIAGDVHGKNHATTGTFGAHVETLELLTAKGDVLKLNAADRDPLFAATVGGMGLTGVILRARIRLRRIDSPLLSVDTDRCERLEEVLAALRAPGGSYRVAWLDLLGPRAGRGVVTRAEHLAAAEKPAGTGASPTVRASITVPSGWPAGILRPATVRAFNELRFQRAPRRERGRLESIGAHMFPLDRLAAWPRLYGQPGLVQYQLVVPYGAERVLELVIERLRRARIPSYLAVLKDFGEANDAPLSFPIAGWTLALDLPRGADGLWPLLDGFDQLVADAGGRVYLSKDARIRPDMLAAMYPRLEQWRQARERADPDRLWRSDLAERTGLVAAGPRSAASRASAPAARVARAPVALARRVLLLGGTSEIGLAIVRRLARDGRTRPYLIGRDRDRLAASLAELERAGCAGGGFDVLDVDNLERHAQALDRAFATTDGFDVVVLAVGVLGAQSGLDSDPAERARSSSSPASPRSGRAPATRSTAPPRRASTRSRRGSPTPPPAVGCGCWWCGRGSCARR